MKMFFTKLLGIFDVDVRYRGDMRNMHILFSEYMLPRLKCYRNHIASSADVIPLLPDRYDENGNIIGRCSYGDWLAIVDDIIFSLEHDINIKRNGVGIMPDSLIQVNEYLNQMRDTESRYRRGLRLLGLYYSNLWA